jgi:hypothetical protein
MTEPEEPELPETAALPRTVEPPAELEERVVAALRERGLVGRRRGSGPSWPLLAAASLAAVFCGWVARGLLAPPAPVAAAEQEFVLLLAEPHELRTDKPTAALVAEYRAWAMALAEQGKLSRAAKLAWEGRRLGSPVPGDVVEAAEPYSNLAAATGFFVLRARNVEEALAIARSCPHLAYGGEISVRPVERTVPQPSH